VRVKASSYSPDEHQMKCRLFSRTSSRRVVQFQQRYILYITSFCVYFLLSQQKR